MKRKYVGFATGTLMILGAALSLPSCGHDQKLVGLTIQPQTATFLTNTDSTQTVQYSAIGSYIHPPATKDITDQVTWSVDASNIVNITQTGVVTAFGSPGCGGVNITATAPAGTGGAGNILTANATAVVDDPTNVLCPGGGQLGSLAVGVVGSGSVTSLPVAINCTATGGTCVATYDVGASVLLTASAADVVWANCPGSSSNTCVVTIPTGGTAVSATFP
jgi:hypothetical protein